MFRDKLELDKWGYIKTDEDMRTNLPGVYAVGDVISKKYRQITTAVADGTIAAISIAKELDFERGKNQFFATLRTMNANTRNVTITLITVQWMSMIK